MATDGGTASASHGQYELSTDDNTELTTSKPSGMNNPQKRKTPLPRKPHCPSKAAKQSHHITDEIEVKANAMDKVFWIVELSEAIVLELPVVSVLKMRKVSRTFQTIVDTSPSVRKKIFLVPRKRVAPWAWRSDYRMDAPLLPEVIAVVCADSSAAKALESGSEGLDTVYSIQTVLCNPLLLSPGVRSKGPIHRNALYYRLQYASLNENHPCSDDSVLSALPVASPRVALQRFEQLSDDSLSMSMYLTDPPVSKVRYRVEVRTGLQQPSDPYAGPEIHYGTVIKPEGLRWKDIVNDPEAC